MRVLFLSHRIPYPPDRGDKIRAYHILRHLLRHHEVTVAGVLERPGDRAAVAALSQRVGDGLFVPIRPTLRKCFFWPATLWRSPFRGQSLTVRYFYSATLQQRLDDHIDRHGVDAIFCCSSPMAEYVFRSRAMAVKSGRILRLMDLIDVDSHKWREYAETRAQPAAWVYRREAACLEDYERRILSAFHHVLVVSDAERALCPLPAGAPRPWVMPNGVDQDYFSPAGAPSDTGAGTQQMVFTGVMDYWPNVEGVVWFVQYVFPLIRAAVPQCRFVIVGSRPTPAVRRLQRVPGVSVTGYVPDVRGYLHRAALCVAPLRIARGIQNKVLEAMACGKAVVATPSAAEGIVAGHPGEIIVADGAKAFAAAVIDLLREPAHARRIGAAARARVEKSHRWDATLAILDDLVTTPPAPPLVPAHDGSVRPVVRWEA